MSRLSTLDPDTLRRLAGAVDDVGRLKPAVLQLEREQRDLMQRVEQALAAIRQQTFDPRNGRYRGLFDSAEEARAFGLYVVSETHSVPQTRAWAGEEFKRGGFPVTPRAMGEVPDSVGGSLVPADFIARLIRLIERYGVATANLLNIPMGSSELHMTRQTGEVDVFLTAEGVAATDSKPSFADVNLVAKEWGTLTYYPRILDDDSIIPIAELVARSIAYAFARKMDLLAFNGDGNKTYFGVLGLIPKLLALNGIDDGGGLVLGSSSTWPNLALADFENMAAAVPDYADVQLDNDLGWYCHKKFYWSVMVRLMLAAGGVRPSDIIGQLQPMFLGYPVHFTQVMPKATAVSAVPCLFGNLRLAGAIGIRRQMGVMTSLDYKFAERLVTMMGTGRFAVDIHDIGTATDAGPVVGLITKASG